MSKKLIIAVDGPAASGKGTIAKKLAATLNLAHMDTGALYRLVGEMVLVTGGDPDDETAAVRAARELQRIFKPEMTDNPAIRTAEAGQAASKVARFAGVRAALFDLQVAFAHNPPDDKDGAVLDGRDIGTTIAPDADLKFYIIASTEVRAQRRTLELQAKDPSIRYDDILADMQQRDARDAGRDIVPMKPADDAIVIDTSGMRAEEVFERVMGEIGK